MNCLSKSITQSLDYAYAHHIQRLMIAGLFTLLYGVNPKHVHDWFMAMYLDSVEWVTLPNTLGLSQYADGGIVGTKPYIASGKYVNRMSNYCRHCTYSPDSVSGEDACPFTVMYWNFLIKHEDRLKDNRRMTFQFRNLNRKSADFRMEIAEKARMIQEQILNGKI